MSNLDIDIKKTATLARKIDKLVNEYNNSIDDFFNQIDKTAHNGAWVGDAANKYRTAVTQERARDMYKSFGVSLRDYVDAVAYSSDEITKVVSKLNVK